MNWRRGIRRLWFVVWLLGCGTLSLFFQGWLEPRPFSPGSLVHPLGTFEPLVESCDKFDDQLTRDGCEILMERNRAARLRWLNEVTRVAWERTYWQSVSIVVAAIAVWSLLMWGGFYGVRWIARGFTVTNNNL